MADRSDVVVSLGLDSAGYQAGLRSSKAELDKFAGATSQANVVFGNFGRSAQGLAQSHQKHENSLRSLKGEIVGTQRTVNFFARSLNDVIPASSGAGEALRILGAGLVGGFGIGFGIEVVIAGVKLLAEHFSKATKEAEEFRNIATDRIVKTGDAIRALEDQLGNVRPEDRTLSSLKTLNDLLAKRAQIEKNITQARSALQSVSKDTPGVNTTPLLMAFDAAKKELSEFDKVWPRLRSEQSADSRLLALQQIESARDIASRVNDTELHAAMLGAADKKKLQLQLDHDLAAIDLSFSKEHEGEAHALQIARRRAYDAELLELGIKTAREHAATMRALQLQLTVAHAPTQMEAVQAQNAAKMGLIDDQIREARRKGDVDAEKNLGTQRVAQARLNEQAIWEARLAIAAAEGKRTAAVDKAEVDERYKVALEELRREAELVKQRQELLQEFAPFSPEAAAARARATQAQVDALRGADLSPGTRNALGKGIALKSRADVQAKAPDLFAGTQEQIDLRLEQMRTMYEEIDQMRKADLITEQTAQQMRSKVSAKEDEVRLSGARDFFGTLAQLQSSSNREIAAIGKAAAIAQATIDGVLAVQKALASAPPPWNFAIATAVGAVTAANVAQIAATGFMRGGYTGPGPVDETAGLVHRREFVVNAAATSRYRPMLEAINKGQSLPVGEESLSPVGFFSLSIENRGTAQNYEAAPTLTPNEIRLIAKDEASRAIRADAPHVIASQFNAPNSRVSESVARSLMVARRR